MLYIITWLTQDMYYDNAILSTQHYIVYSISKIYNHVSNIIDMWNVKAMNNKNGIHLKVVTLSKYQIYLKKILHNWRIVRLVVCGGERLKQFCVYCL